MVYKNITFTVDEEVYVDWGDSDYKRYPAGTITGRPVGVVNIRSAKEVKTITFDNDSAKRINITSGVTLENLKDTCSNSNNLKSFHYAGINNVLSLENGWNNCKNLEEWYMASLAYVDNFDKTWEDTFSLQKLGIINSRAGTKFKNSFKNSGIKCIELLDTTQQTITEDMFLGTNLYKPDNIEQADLKTGIRWLNADSCPALCEPGLIYTNSNIPSEFLGSSPIANAGPDLNGEIDTPLIITGSGTDPDGVIESYEWTKGVTVLSTSAQFNFTPTVAGPDTLKLTVTDNSGLTGIDFMDVITTVGPIVHDCIGMDEWAEWEIPESITDQGQLYDGYGLFIEDDGWIYGFGDSPGIYKFNIETKEWRAKIFPGMDYYVNQELKLFGDHFYFATCNTEVWPPLFDIYKLDKDLNVLASSLGHGTADGGDGRTDTGVAVGYNEAEGRVYMAHISELNIDSFDYYDHNITTFDTDLNQIGDVVVVSPRNGAEHAYANLASYSIGTFNHTGDYIYPYQHDYNDTYTGMMHIRSIELTTFTTSWHTEIQPTFSGQTLAHGTSIEILSTGDYVVFYQSNGVTPRDINMSIISPTGAVNKTVILPEGDGYWCTAGVFVGELDGKFWATLNQPGSWGDDDVIRFFAMDGTNIDEVYYSYSSSVSGTTIINCGFGYRQIVWDRDAAQTDELWDL